MKKHIKTDNKSIVLGILGVAILAFIITSFTGSTKSNTLPEEIIQTTQATNSKPVEVKKTSTTKTKTETTPKEKELTYAEALEVYKDKRIQLDSKCQAFPSQVTYKNDTKVMLDNRSAAKRSINFGSTFSLDGYGFKIVTLKSTVVPSMILLSCDQQPNVGSVLLQK
jgi:hypothetical protein